MNNFTRFLKGTHKPGTIDQIATIYIKNQDHLSRHTRRRIYYSLRKFSEFFNNAELNTLGRAQLSDYYDSLWGGYARDTIRTMIGDLKTFAKWAKKKKHIKKNFAKHLKSITPSLRTTLKRIATDNQAQKLIGYLTDQLKPFIFRDLFGFLVCEEEKLSHKQLKLLRDLFVITFLYETGARVGELAALTSKSMNQAQQLARDVSVIDVYGKTKNRVSERYYTNKTAELWRLWSHYRPNIATEPAVIGWYYFHPHNPMKPQGISNMIARRCKEAGIKPFRANALRHAKIRRGRQLTDLELTSKLIGHSSINTTRRYDYIDDNEIVYATRKTGLKRDFWRD